MATTESPRHVYESVGLDVITPAGRLSRRRQPGLGPLCALTLINVSVSARSSIPGPSSRCVDENWGGSPKSKVSWLVTCARYGGALTLQCNVENVLVMLFSPSSSHSLVTMMSGIRGFIAISWFGVHLPSLHCPFWNQSLCDVTKCMNTFLIPLSN